MRHNWFMLVSTLGIGIGLGFLVGLYAGGRCVVKVQQIRASDISRSLGFAEGPAHSLD